MPSPFPVAAARAPEKRLGGVLLSFRWDFRTTFCVLAVLAAISAVAMLVGNLQRKREMATEEARGA